MRLSFFRLPRWPMLIYAATWTTILTAAVAVASLTPEMAFVSAVSPFSSLSEACSTGAAASVSLPLDFPSQKLCFPAAVFERSKMDMVVPPIFAAAVVASAAVFVKALGLWEAEDDDD